MSFQGSFTSLSNFLKKHYQFLLGLIALISAAYGGFVWGRSMLDSRYVKQKDFDHLQYEQNLLYLSMYSLSTRQFLLEDKWLGFYFGQQLAPNQKSVFPDSYIPLPDEQIAVVEDIRREIGSVRAQLKQAEEAYKRFCDKHDRQFVSLAKYQDLPPVMVGEDKPIWASEINNTFAVPKKPVPPLASPFPPPALNRPGAIHIPQRSASR